LYKNPSIAALALFLAAILYERAAVLEPSESAGVY